MDLKRYCEKLGLTYPKALMYKFALEHQEEGVLDFFLERFSDEEVSLYKINLTDVRDGILCFKDFEDDEYIKFIDYLKTAGMTPTGFPMFETEYVIFKPNSKDLKNAFFNCKKLNKFSTEELVQEVYNFYTKEIKFKPTVDKFIKENL